MNNSKLPICGIDVSKDNLDSQFRNNVNRYDNTVKGIKKLAKENPNAHYILESTGGYERLAAWTLMSEGYKVSIVNPKRVRDFVKGMSILAKTDKLDANVIVQYAEVARPRETQLPSEEYRHLVAIMDRRHQLIKMKIAEENRCGICTDPEMKKCIKGVIQYFNKKIKLLEREMSLLIKSDEEMSGKSHVMQQMKGIGIVSVAHILAYMPEIGTLNKKEVAALLGAAPFNRDSGHKSKRRCIYGGRKKLRSGLYMATVSATTHNQHLKEFYYHLRNDNNCKEKVARIAVMRKMLIAVNSLMKNEYFELAS